MKTSIKVSGFRELEKALAEELPKATAQNVLRKAVRAGLEPVRDAARGHAPVQTGHLRDSIGIKSFDAEYNAAAHASFKDTGSARGVKRAKGRTSMAVAPIVRQPSNLASYALYQEFGTVNMPANPYMRPAADSHLMGAVDIVRDELALQIDKAKARIARKAAKGK